MSPSNSIPNVLAFVVLQRTPGKLHKQYLQHIEKGKPLNNSVGAFRERNPIFFLFLTFLIERGMVRKPERHFHIHLTYLDCCIRAKKKKKPHGLNERRLQLAYPE